MAKARVAIIEDDITLSNAMKAAFERSGIEVFATAREDEIESYLKQNPVNTLFVDCLLPSGSGIDVVSKIRKSHPAADLDIVLMSGLFTDSTFVKESLRGTEATAFLKKPFDLKEALDCVKIKETVAQAQEDASPRKKLYQLFNKPKVTVREKRKAIEALEDIHGFDLPFLYSLMIETQATGHLNIAKDNGDLLGISFSQGKIVTVDVVDQETQIGKLLIESGYILPDDLEAGLATAAPKRIGQRLIHANLLSPHAFDIALSNQMSIRLSRTISDMPIRVNFVATDVELTYPHIDSEMLTTFLHDWIASKISPVWLKAHYTQWGEYAIVKSGTYDPSSPVLNMPLISHLEGFVDFFTNGNSLNKLIESKKFPEDVALKGLHLLLTKGVLIFGDRALILDPVERLKSLNKIFNQVKNKSKIEVWDVITQISGITEAEPQLIFSEFKKILGPAPGLDTGTKPPPELVKVFTDLSSLAQEAFQISQSGSREQIKEIAAREAFESKMKGASFFEEAKKALEKSQYPQAVTFLKKAGDIDPSLEKLKLYGLWAKLGPMDPQVMKPQVLREIEMELMQIPPEEKFDSLFSFVMGLMHKAKGDFPSAKKLFEKAYNLDNNFLIARREMVAVGNRSPAKKDGDLKDMVAGFFKRK